MSSHIATRVHLSLLQPQKANIGGADVPQLFFGVSVSAAPYIGDPADLPPTSSNGVDLQPYLPWEWLWLDDGAGNPPGFRWTLFVRMESKPPAAGLHWKLVPPAKVHI